MLDRFGNDHFTHGGDPVGLKEHMLGATQADAFGTEGHSLLGVVRGVGVGTHFHGADRVGPTHEGGKIVGHRGFHGGDQADIHVAGGAVDGDFISLFDLLAVNRKILFFFVDDKFAAAGYTAFPHAAGHDRRMGGHAAPRR
ncbi:hypothetical protein SDC9_177324 [bioreactor metagenome]|uniref:Uncharacterized protein n=1 Tax=bioreactor metagenome TaxID=1076179 RepID=A0A645GSP4_9ZZZZ